MAKEFVRPKDLRLGLDIPHNWGSWFYFKDHTVIRALGSPIVPHRLPITIQVRVSLLEIMHQLVETDKSLSGGAHKKGSMIPSQVMIGMYHLFNRREYKILYSMLNRFRLPRANYRFYDSKWFIHKIRKENIPPHQWHDEEDIIINVEDYNDVLKRKERWYKIHYEEHTKRREDSA